MIDHCGVEDLSRDLTGDYDEILTLMIRDFERVQQSINYIASLASIQQSKSGVKEAERSTEQNRVVLVLAVVATFFLPISTAATVLNISGDWAPNGSKFGLF